MLHAQLLERVRNHNELAPRKPLKKGKDSAMEARLWRPV
jgi:hypothetical protein